jgi:hypothetical protein
MQHIAGATARGEASEGSAGRYVLLGFVAGIAFFLLYVILNNPGGDSKPPSQTLEIGIGLLFLAGLAVVTWVIPAAERWFGRRFEEG